MGIREHYYFGLQFTDKKDKLCWLQNDHKIVKHDIPKQCLNYQTQKHDGSNEDQYGYHFYFLVKFYPENVEEELIQDVTRHLFYLQIKQSILNMELYCSPEASVLLASYACQQMYGPCNDATPIDLGKLLPQSVINQFEMSPEMWEERIRKWWVIITGMSAEEAEIEYLKIAQELEMFGIQYYPICNQKETDLLLGVSAQGIGIYKNSNKITPRPFFMFSEIRSISFENKLFIIKIMDKSKIKFKAQHSSVNQSVLDLCSGTHNLYLRRRQPDVLEVQQMKIQANEHRQRQANEKAQLEEAKLQRQIAENERDQIKADYEDISERYVKLQKDIQQSDISFKTMKFGQNGMSEVDLMTKQYEQSVASKPQYRSQIYLSEFGKQYTFDMPTFQKASLRHSAVHIPKQQSINSTNSTINNNNNNNHVLIPTHSNSSSSNNDRNITASSSISVLNGDIQLLRSQLETSRNEINEKNRALQERLHNFRLEIESLKRNEYLSEHDKIHEKNLQTGIDKYSALRKSVAGSGSDFI
uniref:Moesin/ezrin/radixin homolog 1 n=1 Tax=Rhabditophanes sp. KR3021 TaxID=114890 RepID=A0AC35THA0_9BILA